MSLRPGLPPIAVTPPPRTGIVLEDGSFFGRLTGQPEERYLVQATTNFEDWSEIGIGVSDFYGNMTFTDPDAEKHAYRFYRGAPEQ